MSQIEIAMLNQINNYFESLNGESPHNLYEQFMSVAERSLIEEIMYRANWNQVLASKWLKINRNTLRKKLIKHGLI